MAGIKGQKVILHEKIQNGEDDFKNPIYEESIVEVENVLIEPASNDAVITEQQLTGKHMVYVLHIPKGDNHNWKDAVVEFYGETWNTFGDCMIYDQDLIPLKWNKKVKVERYE